MADPQAACYRRLRPPLGQVSNLDGLLWQFVQNTVSGTAHHGTAQKLHPPPFPRPTRTLTQALVHAIKENSKR